MREVLAKTDAPSCSGSSSVCQQSAACPTAFHATWVVVWWMRISAAILAGVLPCGPALAAKPEQFRFWKPILPSPIPQEEIFALPLDSDVYSAVREGFADLRIFDSQQRETPYLLEKAFTTVTKYDRRWASARVNAVRELENNRLEIILELPPEIKSADGLKIDTPLRDFERHVQVFGSDDGLNWTQLVKEGFLYDYSRFMDVRGLEIRLPANKYRFFKLLIDEITDSKESPWTQITQKTRYGQQQEKIERFQLLRRPLRIDQVQLWCWVPRTEKRHQKAEYSNLPFQVQEDPKQKCTIVEIQTQREPLERFLLKTKSRNFHREVSVQVPVPRQARSVRDPDPLSAVLDPSAKSPAPAIQWSTIASGRMYVLHFRQFHEEHLTIDFPEHRSPQYRLVISNQDSPPIEVSGVDAAGPVYQLVFLGQQQESYRLYYGADAVDKPQYDTGHVLPSLRSGYTPAPAKLEAKAVAQEPREPAQPMTLLTLLNHPVFLIGAIVLVVIILACGLVLASRRIEHLPHDQPPDS